MRLAAFNVENLFQRARVFNDPDPQAHRDVLDAHAELGKLIERPVYTDADKARMVELVLRLRLNARNEAPHVRLQRIRGKFLRWPRADGTPGMRAPEVIAAGRADWVGWVELRVEAVNELAMAHTARVLADSGADVVALVEVESRPAFLSFQTLLSKNLGIPEPFAQVMVIDGNDPRGIDVGLAARAGYRIGLMRSHVDSPGGGPSVFSRDCPVYEVTTPAGGRLLVLPNHFKSKFDKDQTKADARRTAQANAVKAIYEGLRAAGEDMIAILGDLNDTPDSAPLAGLLACTDLREVSDHPHFTEFEFRGPAGQRGIGTHKLGGDRDKIDYILLSPALWARMTRGGIFRRGAWPGVRPRPRWDVYPELRREVHAASDHHLIWADLDI